MDTLYIPWHVLDEIRGLVIAGPTGCETGVTLFGASLESTPDTCRVVLAIAGPGRKATHEPAHYSGDDDYANEIWAAMRSAMPSIQWLGELHLHPAGMTWLSGGDLQTVRRILTGTDATLHPEEFIAGVMQCRDAGVDIYPFRFTRERLEGTPMQITVVSPEAPEVQEARQRAITAERAAMVDPVFARNPKEAERLAKKHLALIGCGSGGSALAAMAARAGIGRFTLVDPDVLALENVGRHILSRGDVGAPKVDGLKRMIEEVNPAAQVEAHCGRFEGLSCPPDLIIGAADSFACASAINDYSLREGIPAVYCGCWGEASVGEILYVVPRKTPCYQCYAGFRRSTVEVPEIPADPRKYTDPDFDATKLPGQAGLWANILMVSGLGFQVILALLDPDGDRAPLIDHERTLFLLNVSKYDSYLQPLAVTRGKVRKGCAVCDESALARLGSNLTTDAPDGTGVERTNILKRLAAALRGLLVKR